jgi:hemerythrin
MNITIVKPASEMEEDHEVSAISWNDNLSVGIELIDNQHKNLITLTNQLYQACTRGGDKREVAFKDVMSGMVNYVRIHFTTEQELFKRINYPHHAEHKREHDNLTVKVIEASQEYAEGKKTVANDFARYLKDWILSHIAHSDKLFAYYIADQKKKGLLTDKEMEALTADLV